jgi:hypothetical protein
MAQDERIELNLPCDAVVVDDRDTVSFDLPINSLEDLEELRQYNSGNPAQMLAGLASGEYHPPVLQHDRPIEFKWGDYTLPILQAMGRDQPPHGHGRGRTPATQEEIASLREFDPPNEKSLGSHRALFHRYRGRYPKVAGGRTAG